MTLSLMACGLRGMHITPNGAEYIEPPVLEPREIHVRDEVRVLADEHHEVVTDKAVIESPIPQQLRKLEAKHCTQSPGPRRGPHAALRHVAHVDVVVPEEQDRATGAKVPGLVAEVVPHHTGGPIHKLR
eukprot:CAMPEP_0115318832 /NCGR_PEP_ID=MMETSP0270-20121206/79421_1 /TAXON_ID=71861 /ORGANISM="Scrippsiella trochoidea, Strain CCMP3099" /LENGTH=128 /DNA_ID=CAMNT_0002738441 /DNA_START=218 /DNA_END=600 /DNA_ORIENTATION=+